MTFPWHDWQFYVATLLCGAGLYWWLRPWIHARKLRSG